MTGHPSVLGVERRRAAPPPPDGSLQEMLELIDVSPLGAPATRRLRALADRTTIDALVEAHMDGIAETRPPTPTPAPPTGRDSSRPSMDTEWMARGNCAHESPAAWFPSDGVGVEVARRICNGCPVRETCLEYALANRIDHGVWGGCSERERRRILKRRRIAALTQGSPPSEPGPAA